VIFQTNDELKPLLIDQYKKKFTDPPSSREWNKRVADPIKPPSTQQTGLLGLLVRFV
jgi:hypothetical protein